MSLLYTWWAISAMVLVVAAAWLGHRAKGNTIGILLDARNRFSLTRFQIVLWTILVLSLIAGTVITRLVAGLNPLGFTIPDSLLILMGISVGSTASAEAIKAGKDARGVTGATPQAVPRFAQCVLTEEGQQADKVVDITKFQNFWITLIVAAAYLVTAISELSGLGSVAELTALPEFGKDGSWLILSGISHAGYLAGKLPDKP